MCHRKAHPLYLLCQRFVLPGGFLDCFVVTREGGEGSELCCPLKHGHLRMFIRDMMRKVDDVVVKFHPSRSNYQLSIINCQLSIVYALWPPICLFLSLAVAPSAKLVPFRMAFLPKRCLMLMSASCIRRSFFFDCSSLAMAS